MTNVKRTLANALAVTLPVLAGYVFLGAAVGMLMHKNGYGPVWAVAAAVTVYAGAGQLVLAGLLALAFQPMATFVLTVTVNARHLFYSVAMLQRYAGTGWKKPFLIFWLTDETFSLVTTAEPDPGVDQGWFYFAVSGLNHLYWIAGCLLGNLFGAWTGFDIRGVDFVMTALFVAVFVGQWRRPAARVPSAVGFLCTLAALVLLGRDHFLVPGMLAIVAVLLYHDRRHGQPKENQPCP